MTPEPKTIHASAVLVGHMAVLIRGPSGSGKSRLAFDLILAGRARQIPATLLIGDDRIHLMECDGTLISRPAPSLAGLLEIRGLGIRRCDHAAEGMVGLVIDLAAKDAERLPEPHATQVRIYNTTLPRLPVGIGYAPLPVVIAAIITEPFVSNADMQGDCSQEMINHIRPTLATF